MYRFEVRGCLPFLIFGLILSFVAIKLLPIFLLFALLYVIVELVKSFLRRIKLEQLKNEQNFTPHKGEVYKICPYCGSSIKRSTEVCPHCGKTLD